MNAHAVAGRISRRVLVIALSVSGILHPTSAAGQEAHTILSRTFPVKGGRTVHTLAAQARPVGRLSARPLVAPSLRGSVVTGSDRRSTTEGWVFGFDLGGAAVSFEHKPSDRAGLVGARVGYGLNRIRHLYLSAYETDVDVPEFDAFDKVTFGHIDLGVRLHLANSRRRWVPYGDLAVTFWPVSDVLKNGERTTTDFGGRANSSLGGGLAIYLSEAWALDVNVKRGTGGFKDVPVGNISIGGSEEHVHTFLGIWAESDRFTVGVSWWP